eukprot:IDg4589t1
MKFIEKASQTGDQFVIECTALCKMTGNGTKQDQERSFRMASSNESTSDMWLVLGACHFYGIGTLRSKRKARDAFPKTIIDLQYDFRLTTAEGLKQNPLVLGYLKHFAELDELAASELFSVYLCHLAREESSYADEAMKWTQRAANLDSMYCQHQYASLCEDVRFGEIRKSEAYRYYRLAAKQGYNDAQLAVARFYMNGIGVSRDLNKA